MRNRHRRPNYQHLTKLPEDTTAGTFEKALAKHEAAAEGAGENALSEE